MKAFIYSLLIPIFLLFSCRKNKFIPCEDFEKIVGEWRSINTDFEERISITDRGVISIYPTTERKRRYKTTSCSYITTSQNLPPYFKFSLRNSESNVGLLVNSTFDTIGHYGGAFNKLDTLDTLGSLRRYIRLN